MRWLKQPETEGVALDDPRLVVIRRRIIQKNHFLNRLYREWYQQIQSSLPAGDKPVVELGSGAGFLHEIIPGVLSTDIMPYARLDLTMSGLELPFRDGSLRAIVMTDVLHHIPDIRRFFREAARCIAPGGAISMIEPWNTNWARFVYTHFHNEAFITDAKDWGFVSSGPLSGANDALPWIIFERDLDQFRREYPEWRLSQIELTMPVCYLCSGGVSYRNLLPAFMYPAVRFVERKFFHLRSTAMFALINLIRNPN